MRLLTWAGSAGALSFLARLAPRWLPRLWRGLWRVVANEAALHQRTAERDVAKASARILEAEVIAWQAQAEAARKQRMVLEAELEAERHDNEALREIVRRTKSGRSPGSPPGGGGSTSTRTQKPSS